MKREDRYVVIKRSDIFCNLTITEDIILNSLLNKIDSKGTYVVVSKNWPMYEDTWKAIEEWVDNE